MTMHKASRVFKYKTKQALGAYIKYKHSLTSCLQVRVCLPETQPMRRFEKKIQGAQLDGTLPPKHSKSNQVKFIIAKGQIGH